MGGRWMGLAVACAAACGDRVDRAALERERIAVTAADEALRREHALGEDAWYGELRVWGETPCAGRAFAWQDLDLRDTTLVTSTTDWFDGGGVHRYEGLTVGGLLDQCAVPEDAAVTFLAFDAFRATMPARDLRRYPAMLARRRDGEPITRKQGGPAALVLPYDAYPEVSDRYPGRFLVQYVTDIVVGTEPATLRVRTGEGTRTLDSAALASLPQARHDGAHGFNIAWPTSSAVLLGPRVRDVVAAAGVTVTPTMRLELRGKARVYADDLDPVIVTGAQVLADDVLVVTQHGDPPRPLDAMLGGPLAIAYPAGTTRETIDWVTFLEEIVVLP